MNQNTSEPIKIEKKDEHDPEGLGLHPHPSQIGEVQDTETPTYDAVFGEITEDGPNYRNVCLPSYFHPMAETNVSGRFPRYRRPHDENPDRFGCSVDSRRFRRTGLSTRCHLSVCYCWYIDMVGLCHWAVQAST